jgi:hypothetical protein
MKLIVGEHSGWLHMLVWLGLFGLVASFHGIILGYSRQIFALAREAYLPERIWLESAPALQDAASRDHCGRRDRHRRDLSAAAPTPSPALRELLAKATPARSGDYLAGVAAGSAEERVAAQMALADLPLTTFLNEGRALRNDEVTRLIVDTPRCRRLSPIRHLTVGGLRDWLLGDAADEAALARPPRASRRRWRPPCRRSCASRTWCWWRASAAWSRAFATRSACRHGCRPACSRTIRPTTFPASPPACSTA